MQPGCQYYCAHRDASRGSMYQFLIVVASVDPKARASGDQRNRVTGRSRTSFFVDISVPKKRGSRVKAQPGQQRTMKTERDKDPTAKWKLTCNQGPRETICGDHSPRI